MVVAVLPQGKIPGQHNDRLSAQQRFDDVAHPRVRDDDVRRFEPLVKLIDCKPTLPRDMARYILTVGNLRKHLYVFAVLRPLVHRPDKSVESELRADTNEDHRTCPSNFAPVSCATSSHCVIQRSHHRSASFPESDITSALAMLSIHTVLAPRIFPRMTKARPGAAPVVNTTCGRFHKSKATHWAPSSTNLHGLSRAQSTTRK